MSDKVMTQIHTTLNVLNPYVYFLLDDRLILFDVCTPNFNDFNEWRVSFGSFQKNKFKINETEKLNKLSTINDVIIDDETYTMLTDMGNMEDESISDDEYEALVSKYDHDGSGFCECDEFVGGFGENETLLVSYNNKYIKYDNMMNSDDLSLFHKLMGPIFKEIILGIYKSL